MKIHPISNGNGRTARLLERWFLREQFGPNSAAIALEKNYFRNRAVYYRNIRVLGLEYETLDYNKSISFYG